MRFMLRWRGLGGEMGCACEMTAPWMWPAACRYSIHLSLSTDAERGISYVCYALNETTFLQSTFSIMHRLHVHKRQVHASKDDQCRECFPERYANACLMTSQSGH